MIGKIITIHRVAHPRGLTERLVSATLITNQGLEGDWRSKPGKIRQVTLIEEEELAILAAKLGREIAPGTDRRQIMIRGLSLIEKFVRIGKVLISIEGPCEPCSQMETYIGPGAKELMKGRGGVTGRVIHGGEIREGDDVESTRS